MIDQACRELFTDLIGQNGILRKTDAAALKVALLQAFRIEALEARMNQADDALEPTAKLNIRIDTVVKRMHRADVRMDFFEALIEKPAEPQTEGPDLPDPGKTGYDLAVEYVVEQISMWDANNRVSSPEKTAQVTNIEQHCDCIPVDVTDCDGQRWIFVSACGCGESKRSYATYRRACS